MSHKSGSKHKPGQTKPRSLKARAELEKAKKTRKAKVSFVETQAEKASIIKKAAAKKKIAARTQIASTHNIQTNDSNEKLQAATSSASTPGRQQITTASDSSLKIYVKTSNKRKLSSTLWLQRQLNDPFVQKAKREGYRSRAAYKFLEINERYGLIKQGQRIVDLGCAPGGWSQIAARETGSVDGREGAKVIGIDLLDVEAIPGVILEKLDFTLPQAPTRLKELLGGDAHGVLSDMAANTIGHKKTDHIRIIALAEMAIDFAREVLAPNGFFVAKVFQGGTENELLANLRRDFKTVRHVKPKASRADSAELYVLATGFRGKPPVSMEILK
jgi:23S rRNA (uridine2552-2'-O)-methyltransferase